jgi:tetratricopeptide (TPR) repeat protein
MTSKKDRITQSDEHNQRGIELADRGWLDEAMNEFKKAIELDPESAHAHDNLATVLAEKGRFIDALESYVKAVRLEPQNPNTYHYLASFLSSRSFDASVSLYKHTLELDPEFIDAHVNLALTYGDRGMLDEATSNLEQAIKLDPDDEGARHELAAVLMDAGRFADAIGHLRKICKDYPDHTDAFIDLGIAYTAQGFYREAERALLEALKLDAEDVAGHYHLSSLYAFWDKRDAALEYLKNALERNREQTLAWLEDDEAFDVFVDDPRYLELVGETSKLSG